VDRDHELAAVLADDTRYGIYRVIAEHPDRDVTVADVAVRFELHPNVARMHLAKLEQAGFLATGLRRTTGGGRPAKLYRLSEQVVTFGFPPRRYELLSRLALSALPGDGPSSKVEAACRAVGQGEGRRAVAARGDAPRDLEAAAQLIAAIAEEQGLLPEVRVHDGELSITVHNCAFRELSGADPEHVCAMHRAFLEGVLEVVLGHLGSISCTTDGLSISCGGQCCELVCTVAS
jgi:predicted ArsR family transcriptional regulator